MRALTPASPLTPASQLASVTDGAKRTGPLLGLPGLLRELGQAPDTVFAAAGLDSHIQDDPEGAIDFSALGRVIQQCVEATGCPHFGLLWGQSTGISALGLVGMLRQHSPDLGTAVRNVILCFHIHDRGAVPRLTVSGSTRRIVQACVQAP